MSAPLKTARRQLSAAPLKTVRRQLSSAYRNNLNVNFSGMWKYSVLISVVLLLAAGLGVGLRWFNWGIEFEGGESWELSDADTSTSEIRDALRPLGLADARIQKLGNDIYRVRGDIQEANAAQINEVTEALAGLEGVERTNISQTSVGASWGGEITERMFIALVVFLGLVGLYIWLRLEWRMTLAALVAVIHDVVLTVGFYALFQLEVTPATVIAFLTILGYSLYDTLVVFDKIRENEARFLNSRKHSYTDIVELSANQVLMRSINTTITSVLPVLSLLVVGSFVLGAVTLQEFAVALLVGLIAGTYSSLFVATPMTAWLKEREKHWKAVRERMGQYSTGESSDIAQVMRDRQALQASPSRRHDHKRRNRLTAQSRARVNTATHPPRPRKKRRD